jgi:uncharacterized membrane protein YphA (DoxX/SURF4 family)
MAGPLGSLLSSRPLVLAARIGTGLVLAWAGLAKIGDPQAFAEQVHNFRILPVALENLAAMTLPWVEVVASLALLLGVRSRAAAVLATALLAVFTVAVLAAIYRGLDIECGCFGTSDSTHVGWVKVAQNLGMLALAGVASARERGSAG